MNTNTGHLGQSMLGPAVPQNAQRAQGPDCSQYACPHSCQLPLPHQPHLRLPSASFPEGVGQQAQSAIAFGQTDPEGSLEKSKIIYG